MSFSHADRINVQELTPRLFGDYKTLKNFVVADLMKSQGRRGGYNVFALGKSVK